MRGADSGNLGVWTKVLRSVPSRLQAEDGDRDGDERTCPTTSERKDELVTVVAHQARRRCEQQTDDHNDDDDDDVD